MSFYDVEEEKEFWKLVLIGLVVVFIILLIPVVIVVGSSLSGDNIYLYIDLDGNKGIADECSTNEGMMWCRKGDRRITVREYWSNESYVEEKE